jgi:site-specific recombinase XerD
VKSRNVHGTINGTNLEQAVHGVWKRGPISNRPRPFGVVWKVGGRERSEWYADSKDRDKRFDALSKERKRGTLTSVLRRSEVEEYRAIKSAIGSTPWQDVVAGWREHLQSQGKSVCDLTIRDACEKYLAEAEALFKSGRLAADTMRHKRQKIRAFSDAFGSNRLDQVTGEEISTWIEEDLGFVNGETFDSWRRHLRALFAKFGRFVRDNPLDEVDVRGGASDYVNILSVRDTARLFAYALEHKRVAIGRLALEAFAGLRFGSSTRLEKADIHFEDKGILLPAHKLKTGMVDGRRHYVDGFPANLWMWLDVATPDAWTLTGSDWMHIKSDLFTAAEVPHPRNCLRHSFATYHIAACKDPGRIAFLLCHRNQDKLWSNYRGNAEESWGKRYFDIAPETVRLIAEVDDVQSMPGKRPTPPSITP